jgi:peptidoglycan/xylan/chitin deacetylase (PgdA/CDA1 family)
MLLLGIAIISCSRTDQRQRTGTSGHAADDATVRNGAAGRDTENTQAQVYARLEIPVLCYHRIADGKKSEYAVSPATFTSHMKILADSGYHSIAPAQLYDYLVYNKTLPEKPVMITFDDSRVEHSLIAAPVLDRYGFKGVFFIMTITYNKQNYMTTDEIAQLAKDGHTVGLHSWDHTMVTKYTEAADWQKQMVEPKSKLEKIIGRPVEYWAYPNGVYDHAAAVELGSRFKLSFILTTQRDTLNPLQTVRRMIVPECTPQGLLHAMHRTFGKKN